MTIWIQPPDPSGVQLWLDADPSDPSELPDPSEESDESDPDEELSDEELDELSDDEESDPDEELSADDDELPELPDEELDLLDEDDEDEEEELSQYSSPQQCLNRQSSVSNGSTSTTVPTWTGSSFHSHAWTSRPPGLNCHFPLSSGWTSWTVYRCRFDGPPDDADEDDPTHSRAVIAPMNPRLIRCIWVFPAKWWTSSGGAAVTSAPRFTASMTRFKSRAFTSWKSFSLGSKVPLYQDTTNRSFRSAYGYNVAPVVVPSVVNSFHWEASGSYA